MKKSKAKKPTGRGLRAFVKSFKAKKAKRAPVKRSIASRAKTLPQLQAAAGKELKAAKALTIVCPSCRAQVGAPCFDRQGRQVPTPHRLRVERALHPPKSLKAAFASLVSEKGKAPTAASSAPPSASDGPARTTQAMAGPRIALDRIKVGERHRKDFGDLKGLAKSIDDRGGLIQPIALKPNLELIAGERRMRAWKMSRFAGEPIPYHVLDVDAIIAGEWDENAQRKDFTPSEAVKIKRTLEDVLRKLQAPAPTGKRGRPASGRVNDKVGKLTGVSRRSLEKAEAVVDAAERAPELFGDLQAEMDRSGRVNAAHKKLQVREAKAGIVAAPPALPMNAADCATWSIDFPWAGEPDRDQAALDAAGRSFRPYPEMSIKTVCAFAHDQLAPKLPKVVSVWLWVTNFILVRGYHNHVIAALGFKPDNTSTMLTWDKVEIGRGAILRDQTEHAILLTRGGPTIDVFGENPPTTLIREPRRENSRKPDAFYRLAERVTPAKRYAAIFSQGGEGELWDSHGDQVGKFAPAVARAAEAEAIAEAKGEDDPPPSPIEPWRFQLAALLRVNGDHHADISDIDPQLYAGLMECHPRARTHKLTDRGRARLDQLNHLSRLEQLDKLANGRAEELTTTAREQLQTLGYVVGKAKRLTKYGAKERLRLRDFRESFLAVEAAADASGMVKVGENSIAKDFLTDDEVAGLVKGEARASEDAAIAEAKAPAIPVVIPAGKVVRLEDVEQLEDDPPPAPFDEQAERFALAQIAAGGRAARGDAALILARRGLVHAGKESLRLTNLGLDRLAVLNARGIRAAEGSGADNGKTAAEPHQVDLEDAIAATPAPGARAAAAVDDLEIPAFLRRTAEATA